MSFIKHIKYVLYLIRKKIKEFYNYFSSRKNSEPTENDDFNTEIYDLESQVNNKQIVVKLFTNEENVKLPNLSPENINQENINQENIEIEKTDSFINILPSMIKSLLNSIHKENKPENKFEDNISEMIIISKKADQLYVDGKEV